MGVDNLLEMVALTAEVAELKANPNRAASGAVAVSYTHLRRELHRSCERRLCRN